PLTCHQSLLDALPISFRRSQPKRPVSTRLGVDLLCRLHRAGRSGLAALPGFAQPPTESPDCLGGGILSRALFRAPLFRLPLVIRSEEHTSELQSRENL